jgi:hypothetical protein
LGFAACGSSIRQGAFAGPKSLDAPEPTDARSSVTSGFIEEFCNDNSEYFSLLLRYKLIYLVPTG